MRWKQRNGRKVKAKALKNEGRERVSKRMK